MVHFFPQNRGVQSAVGCILFLTGSLLSSAEPISPGDQAFFEKKIRPALIENCYKCHSEQENKRKGGLWLDRKSGWETGGDSGPAIVSGDPDKSLLLHAVSYSDHDLEMPPDGKLPSDVREALKEWIRRGAPDPRGGVLPPVKKPENREIDIEKGKKFWSFQAIRNPKVPSPRNRGWQRNEIDRFILTKLEKAGIAPAPDAPPEARLRRAKIDLTGLLPTVAEQDEFLKNPSWDKWEEMIDRWLASDDFGERWGRHWLDIVRYADTSGGGRAMPFPDAWRFRDYVLESFRKDRPLDELIRSHLAGDLLPYQTQKERSENLIATGFLVLGPVNYENQNKDELNLEIADEQMETMGRAFMGMTIGCARCHDHKFDPIPTRDYYSMAGIFLSTNAVSHANVSKWHTEMAPASDKASQEYAEYKKRESIAQEKVNLLKRKLAAIGQAVGGGKGAVDKRFLKGIVKDDVDAVKTGEWQESTSTGHWVGSGYLHDKGENRGEKSVVFSARIPRAGKYEVRLSYSWGPNRNPAVSVDVQVGAVKKLILVNQKLPPRHEELFESLGVYEIQSGQDTSVTVSNRGKEAGVVVADAVQWLPVSDVVVEKRSLLAKAGAIDPAKLRAEFVTAEKELKQVQKTAPKVPSAMCVVDFEKEKVGGTRIRIRGVEGNKGPKVERGFLQVASWKQNKIPRTHSGRLELAEWLTDPHHPLTARVMANRIWLHLMGRGIVRSADNFGTTGQMPTHPELLDYLASSLIASNWSTKALVKKIMMSRAYSMDSEGGDSRGPELDPENLLFWHASRRMLDVEVLRDAMLTLGDVLDARRGGPCLPEGFKTEFGYQFTTLRRSVYVPVFRNSGFEMFTTFDFANPNFTVGKRSESTIPTQSLFLANSPLLHRYAGEAASALLQVPNLNDESRVKLAFRKTLGRFPSENESRMALDFLRESGDTVESDDADAWAALQRALFACLDFRFLR